MTRAFDRASLLPSDKVTPHIVPDVLYPAVGGVLLDGTTSHSGDYGTAQSSDGRKYYYTDIKGSKPIRDPRIGAHFGSQRHKFKSLQLLEQETATHGTNVYSVDGREWVRIVGSPSDQYDSNGNYINISGTATFIEIVGYFNNVNLISQGQAGGTRRYAPYIDGGSAGTNTTQPSVNSPLEGRYVDSGMIESLTFNSTITSPGIHTLKLLNDTNDKGIYGIELIAQDTTSATTRNQIQIPSQTVVSFGSKFTLSASTPHYHPFNTKSDGTAWSSPTSGTTNTANSSNEWPSVIDTATSLGLSAWVNTSYYRPYNGGRVVIWVDENGEIKTSVNMMPPNSRNIASSADNEKGDDSAGNTSAAAINNRFQPTFTDQAIDHSQAEVAKTFHYREFGNGAANGGTGATYADASMLNGSDDIVYVMDDGLTSLTGDDVEKKGDTDIGFSGATGDTIYLTFIGTGISVRNIVYSGGEQKIAQNLPYGTHVIKMQRDNNNTDYTIDGVAIADYASSPLTYGAFSEISFYQPKMPPIPEEACIIADYMLMADFVKQSDTGSDIRGQISKGSRYVSASRDIFYDTSGSFNAASGTGNPSGQLGIRVRGDGANATGKLPFFGTTASFHLEGADQGAVAVTLGGSATTETALDNTSASHGDALTIAETVDLGLTNTQITWAASYNLYATIVDSPIHTSHHYQTFETPFLYELIGGDRNMEQTHLICSADGKTWDEVTRDTSYLGPKYSLTCSVPNGGSSSGATSSTGSSGKLNSFFTDVRGKIDYVDLHNKGIALAYDSFIPLHDGYYEISVSMRALNGTQLYMRVNVNDNQVKDHFALGNNNDHGGMNFSDTYYMKRGERWDVRIISGTFRIQFRVSTLFQVKYLGSGR